MNSVATANRLKRCEDGFTDERDSAEIIGFQPSRTRTNSGDRPAPGGFEGIWT